MLESTARESGYPNYLRVGNRPEMIASVLETWAVEHQVKVLFIEPGKRTQNAFIESFNMRVRDELLNPNRFRTIFDVKKTRLSHGDEATMPSIHTVPSIIARPRSSSLFTILPNLHRNHWPHDGTYPISKTPKRAKPD